MKGIQFAKAWVFLAVAIMFLAFAPIARANDDMAAVQAKVDRARITLGEFMRDPNFIWLHENIDRARGVLIFPEVLKGGFIWGGSGGNGVFLVRDERTGQWSQPAFYTVGSVTFGLQIGGEAAEVVMVAMTERAVDSLLSSSVKLGGDVSVALGPVGAGAKASADVPRVTADFVSFAKAKGLYAGLNLEGSVIAVRDSLNQAYYERAVTPVGILERHEVTNIRSAGLIESLECKC